MFAAYVLVFYGGSALAGAPERWNKVLPHGWKGGAVVDNTVLAAHLALTVIIVLGGLALVTLVTAFGVVIATAGVWGPRVL